MPIVGEVVSVECLSTVSTQDHVLDHHCFSYIWHIIFSTPLLQFYIFANSYRLLRFCSTNFVAKIELLNLSYSFVTIFLHLLTRTGLVSLSPSFYLFLVCFLFPFLSLSLYSFSLFFNHVLCGCLTTAVIL